MSALYETCHTKRRATAADMEKRKRALLAIVRENQPCTVRQVFYQATVHGVVEKSEAGYARVQRALVELRRDRVMPYGWIVDNTRMMRKPRSYNSATDALAECAKFYRRNLWRDAEAYVEIWLEKDALSGVIYPIIETYDVPLMVARGYASLSFLQSAAEAIAAQERPSFIYHLGDHDPSGVNAGEKIEQTLRELAPSAEIHFERLAVHPEQIAAWNLPSRPTKSSDTRAKKFGYTQSVELDAIPPDTLRAIVQEAIERHIDAATIERLEVAEKSERDILWQCVEMAQEGTV